MRAREDIRQQTRRYYPPDTYKPSTFYWPYSFIVRGKGKTQSELVVRAESYLISLSGGNQTGKVKAR